MKAFSVPVRRYIWIQYDTMTCTSTILGDHELRFDRTETVTHGALRLMILGSVASVGLLEETTPGSQMRP